MPTKLTVFDGAAAADDYFGWSVSVSNGVVAVRGYGDDDKGDFSGSAYIFERNTTCIWVDKDKLTVFDGVADDYFGHSVSVCNGVVVVGAQGDDDEGSSSGSAYIHELLAAPLFCRRPSWVLRLVMCPRQSHPRHQQHHPAQAPTPHPQYHIWY